VSVQLGELDEAPFPPGLFLDPWILFSLDEKNLSSDRLYQCIPLDKHSRSTPDASFTRVSRSDLVSMFEGGF